MSDSASDSKVEDVLSSVRRLVSNEAPRARKPELPQHGALVLTDAQRVEQSPRSRVMSRSLEERIAELEAAVSARVDEWEPDGSEDQSQHRPDRIVYTRPPSTEEQEEARLSTLRLSEIALIDTGPANEDEDPDETGGVTPEFRHDRVSDPEEVTPEAMAAEDEVPEAPMAEDIATDAPPSAEVTIFARPEDEIDRIEARLRLGNIDTPPAVDTSMPTPDVVVQLTTAKAVIEDSDDETSEPIETAETEEAELSSAEQSSEDIDLATEDALEAPDAPPEDDDLEFEAALSEALLSSEPEFEHQSEPEAMVAPGTLDEPEPFQDDTVDTFAASTADAALEDILDEDALRPIVARLIREELQGELGERITRNVRKLVRREILRALNARDLE